MKNVLQLIILLYLIIEVSICFAAPGDFDPSFANCGTKSIKLNGEDLKVLALTLQQDDKIIFVASYQNQKIVARLNQDGTLDDTYGNNGIVYIQVPYLGIIDIVTNSTNKSCVIGITQSPSGDDVLTLIGFLQNGSLNMSYGNNGYKQYDWENFPTWVGSWVSVQGVKLFGNSDIFVYGSSYAYGVHFNFLPIILKFSFNTGSFISYNIHPIFDLQNSYEVITSLANNSNGKMTCTIRNHTGLSNNNFDNFTISKLNTSGSLEPTFNSSGTPGIVTTNLTSNVENMAISTAYQVPNKIIATGYSGNTKFLIRYNNNGTIDSTFGVNGILNFPNLSLIKENILIQQDSKILIKGYNSILSEEQIYRLQTDGIIDTTFGQNGVLGGFLNDGKSIKKMFKNSNEKLIVWTANAYGVSKIYRFEIQDNPQVPLMSACYKDFGIGYVGTTLTDSILVENIDGPTLSISNITLPQNFGFASNSLLPPFSISSGDSAFITISCSLNTIGTIEGEAEIFSNANYSPYKLNLTALSAKPEIQPNASFIDFGFMDILAGQTLFNSKKLGITNNGNYDLIINNFSINGSNANNFFVSNSLPITISPQETGEIDVNFFTIVEGSYAAILEIDSNDPINPISSIALEAEVLLVTDSNEKSNSLPTEFTLLPNYPNPFNPSTKITFGVPEESEVRLEIFNILGKKVKILFQGKVKPAFHTFEWNGLDEFGNKVSNGVYFYKLASKDFIEAKKMLLLK